MFTISHFGQSYSGNGTIRELVNQAGWDIGNNQPYVNGQQISLDQQAPTGSNVTFRPPASGKAA